MKHKIIFCICILLVISLAIPLLAYRQGPSGAAIEPNTYVHQKITEEAEKAWSLLPYEIKTHLTNNIAADPNGQVSFESIRNCTAVYSSNDDIITGSGEKDNSFDTCSAFFANLDSEDNEEIVLHGFYGIKVYDYRGDFYGF